MDVHVRCLLSLLNQVCVTCARRFTRSSSLKDTAKLRTVLDLESKAYWVTTELYGYLQESRVSDDPPELLIPPGDTDYALGRFIRSMESLVFIDLYPIHHICGAHARAASVTRAAEKVKRVRRLRSSKPSITVATSSILISVPSARLETTI